MSTPYCRSKIWCSEYKKEQKYCLLFLDSYSIFFFFGNTRTIRITVSMHMIIMYVILHIPLIGHLACFTFITKKMSKNETRHLNSDSMGHYGMCHWALSWWWGGGCLVCDYLGYMEKHKLLCIPSKEARIGWDDGYMGGLLKVLSWRWLTTRGGFSYPLSCCRFNVTATV